MSIHTPRQPSWECKACFNPWPCEHARARLLAEYQGRAAALALYMGGSYVEASEDLYGTGQLADDLFDRFISRQSGARRSAR